MDEASRRDANAKHPDKAQKGSSGPEHGPVTPVGWIVYSTIQPGKIYTYSDTQIGEKERFGSYAEAKSYLESPATEQPGSMARKYCGFSGPIPIVDPSDPEKRSFVGPRLRECISFDEDNPEETFDNFFHDFWRDSGVDQIPSIMAKLEAEGEIPGVPDTGRWGPAILKREHHNKIEQILRSRRLPSIECSLSEAWDFAQIESDARNLPGHVNVDRRKGLRNQLLAAADDLELAFCNLHPRHNAIDAYHFLTSLEVHEHIAYFCREQLWNEANDSRVEYARRKFCRALGSYVLRNWLGRLSGTSRPRTPHIPAEPQQHLVSTNLDNVEPTATASNGGGFEPGILAESGFLPQGRKHAHTSLAEAALCWPHDPAHTLISSTKRIDVPEHRHQQPVRVVGTDNNEMAFAQDSAAKPFQDNGIDKPVASAELIQTEASIQLPSSIENTRAETEEQSNESAHHLARTPAAKRKTRAKRPSDTSQKGDATLLAGKHSVSFQTAEKYLGIAERQRQKLIKSGALTVEGRASARKITVRSLKDYVPPENPN